MRTSRLCIPDCKDCKNNNSVFCSLNQNEKEVISTGKSSNYFKKGQVVFYEGNHPHGLFCVYSGKVKISKLGEGGKEQIVRFAKSGEMLGYRSILNNEAYNATATAVEDSYICFLKSDNFFQLLRESNSLSFNVMKLLSSDLRSSEKQLISIAQKSVRERIAETLLRLRTRFGLDNEGAINLKLSRQEIGDIAGATSETTIRTLADFNQERVIVLQGKRILILDVNKLTQIANIKD